MQKLPELPFRLPAAALQRAASQAISVAESLRAPDRGLSKQGSAGGNRIIGTKQHFAQKVSFTESPDKCFTSLRQRSSDLMVPCSDPVRHFANSLMACAASPKGVKPS